MRLDELIITLTQVPGVGARTILGVVRGLNSTMPESLGDIRDALAASKRARSSVRSIELDMLRKAHTTARDICEACAKNGCKIITLLDDDYPRLAVEVDSPPPILYVRGDASQLQTASVAVIGTRKPTDYAARAALKIGMRVAESGFAVLSGLAVGCDARAHVGCLRADGVAVAVMPCGLDQVYPRCHENLAAELLGRKGCLVSEYPPGTSAADFRLVARDRLQAILSVAVVVVQSTVQGGSMHAARYATQKLGRPVAALNPTENAQGDFAGNLEIVNKMNGYSLRDGVQLQEFLTRVHANSNHDDLGRPLVEDFAR